MSSSSSSNVGDAKVSEKVPEPTPTSSDKPNTENKEHLGSFGVIEGQESDRSRLNVLFQNPLQGKSQDELFSDVEEFCAKFNFTDEIDLFKKGALIAQNPSQFQKLDLLTDEDRTIIDRERTHKWRQPFMLYWLCIMCSLAAATQGMDETVNNGAQLFYLQKFGFTGDDNQTALMTGLIVGAPYLACAAVGCWMTDPLNRLFARRGTIFISCFIAAVASIWQGVVQSWPNLFVARFVLGLGIGAKSTTVPVYAAECSPALIRGALVMMWQMWTAFGIMLGNIFDVAFLNTGDDLNWRLMLGSTVVLPVIVCAQVYFCPESPRWLVKKDRIHQAYDSFLRLRPSRLQAARDVYSVYVNVQLERQLNRGRNLVFELFTVPRNRRAALASWIVMFMQQFCGVNVIAYYSTSIFRDAGFSEASALLASMGTGIVNWVFALPAVYTIDTFGRRNLLLVTFPLMCIALLWTGFSFFIEPDNPTSRARLGMIATGMYLFEVVYSPGEGPVPFTYSAEAYPLHIRDIGMSFATATTWCFNFILSLTWPILLQSFKPQGAFGWYAAWCIIGWVLVLLFVPETKALSLEALDQVFNVPTWKHARYQINYMKYLFLSKVCRQNVQRPLPFYQGADNI